MNNVDAKTPVGCRRYNMILRQDQWADLVRLACEISVKTGEAPEVAIVVRGIIDAYLASRRGAEDVDVALAKEPQRPRRKR